MMPASVTRGCHRACARLYAVLLIAGASACAPAVTPEAVSTPYHDAVGAYHALVADEIDAEAARAAVTAALAASETDDAIRMVLAQVELHDYRGSGSPAARERLLSQLMAIDASVRSGLSDVDWVEARLYVTLGDLLMLDAQRDRARWLERRNDSAEELWYALLRFAAADTAYRFAHTVGEDEPSPGLVREREHAGTAQFSSTLAVVAAITDLTPSPEGALRRTREEALAYLDAMLRADAATAATVVPPLPAALGFDGSVHVLRAAAYETLALEAYRQLVESCRDAAEVDAHATALDRYVERLWWAGHHAVVARTLGAAYDAGALVGYLHSDASRDPERACELDPVDPSGAPP